LIRAESFLALERAGVVIMIEILSRNHKPTACAPVVFESTQNTAPHVSFD